VGIKVKLVVLSGGTGTPKLLEGLRHVVPEEDITVVVNVADNFWWNDLYIAPDVDTVLYLFANILDTGKYWGIKEDTFNFLQQAKQYGLDWTWFNIGDRDLATHITRTLLMKRGYTLTQVTKYLASKLRIRATVLPATDNHVETYVLTNIGNLHIQEYLVKYRMEPEVHGITFLGLEKAKVTRDVITALEQADAIIIGPSNTVNSILPILKVQGLGEKIKELRGEVPVVAISPIVGNRPFSGPLHKFLKAIGYEPSSYSVAEILRDYVDAMVVDVRDREVGERISKELEIYVITSNIVMTDLKSKIKLAREVVKIIESMKQCRKA